jgi:ABC-2 type transport system ATP-binding protein
VTSKATVLKVNQLAKTFSKPFTGRKVHAVKGVTFEVAQGEVFGFLGPNGAGKTTTIKMLTGLIRATSGSATLFGEAIPSPSAMARVGFLPENPYVYPYLSPREFVTLCARLSGLGGRGLDGKVEAILERVGMGHAMDRAVRALSKGMLQRVGLAAALVHGPELLILDEPMSGLDPMGRKEVRDIIAEEARAGRTVFFSTHILGDVESLCDRVCMLRRGEVVVSGSLRELLDTGLHRSEVTLTGVTPELRAAIAELGIAGHDMAGAWILEVEGHDKTRAVLERALAAGASVDAVTPKRETLEAIFVRRAN